MRLRKVPRYGLSWIVIVIEPSAAFSDPADQPAPVSMRQPRIGASFHCRMRLVNAAMALAEDKAGMGGFRGEAERLVDGCGL